MRLYLGLLLVTIPQDQAYQLCITHCHTLLENYIVEGGREGGREKERERGERESLY